MILSRLRRPVSVEILFILVVGLTPLLWFGRDTIVIGHDTNFRLDPNGFFFDRLFAWTERGGFGRDTSEAIGTLPIRSVEAMLTSLGFSLGGMQRIVFFFWFTAPGIAIYSLLRYFDSRSGAWVFRLTGTALYMFNHFLLQAWFVAERTKFSLVIALPLVLLLIFRVADRRTGPVKAGILIGLTLSVLNGGGVVNLYAAVLLSFVLAIIFFGLLGFGERGIAWSGLAKLIVATTVSFTLLNAYWVLPQLRAATSLYGSRLAGLGGIDAILDSADGVSANASLLNVLRLQGIPDWYRADHQYSYAFFSNVALIVASALLPLLAFAPLLGRSQHMPRRYVFFFSLLALVAIVFTAGTHPPFGFIYRFLLQHVPGFAILRTPFYKFAPALWLAYAVLIALSLSALANWLGSQLSALTNASRLATWGFGALAIAAILAYDFPIFSGSFFNWAPSLTTMVRVPDHVFAFGRWTQSHSDFGRVVLVPPLSNVDTYDWGYLSHALVSASFTPTIANKDSLEPAESAHVNRMYESLRAGDTDAAIDQASLLGAKYFLLRNDVRHQPSSPGFYGVLPEEENPAIYEAILRDADHLFPVQHWGDWTLFQITDSHLSPQFFAAHPDTLQVDNSLRSPSTSPAAGSPPKIIFHRINPTKYLVQVRRTGPPTTVDSPFILVFLDRFSPDWKVYPSPEADHDLPPVASFLNGNVLEGPGQVAFLNARVAETWFRTPLPEDDHLRLYGYANGWLLTQQGDYDLVIEYSPQRVLYLGLAISIVSFLGVIAYFATLSLRNMRKPVASITNPPR